MAKRVVNPAIDPNFSVSQLPSDVVEPEFVPEVEHEPEEVYVAPSAPVAPKADVVVDTNPVQVTYPKMGDQVEFYVTGLGFGNWYPAWVVEARGKVIDLVVLVPSSVPILFKAGATEGDSAGNWRRQ